ncbi:unnamed protein product, partial [Ectocarpus fasciculatus]
EPVYVAVSTLPQAGQGLFASRNIAEGELLCCYEGTVILCPEHIEASSSDYLAQHSGTSWAIDAEFSEYRARFVNDPIDETRMNVDLIYRPECYSSEAIWFRANQDIDQDDEIFVSYGPEYW